jgi:hypothetical protein
MPVSDPHPRSHGHRRVDFQIDAPERATQQPESSRLAFRGSAMDVPDRSEQEPEAITVARCRTFAFTKRNGQTTLLAAVR